MNAIESLKNPNTANCNMTNYTLNVKGTCRKVFSVTDEDESIKELQQLMQNIRHFSHSVYARKEGVPHN